MPPDKVATRATQPYKHPSHSTNLHDQLQKHRFHSCGAGVDSLLHELRGVQHDPVFALMVSFKESLQLPLGGYQVDGHPTLRFLSCDSSKPVCACLCCCQPLCQHCSGSQCVAHCAARALRAPTMGMMWLWIRHGTAPPCGHVVGHFL